MGQDNGKINAINVAANYCIRTFIQILLKTKQKKNPMKLSQHNR